MASLPLRQGIDRFDPATIGRGKVALIANHTAVDRAGRSTVEVLRDRGVKLSCIFSLEHGFFPVAQDMEAVRKEQKIRNIPVVPLYGDSAASLVPSSDLLDRFDTVLYDVQDIGSRYYTYLQSLSLFMDELSIRPKRLIVLDRLNPIGGDMVEGIPVQERYYSFVGRFPLPHRHGLTTGEAARCYYALKGYSFPFEVVPIEGWRRDSFADEYDLPWIPTSPNMPTLDTAILYPGGCLVEGTNLSEGRGTAFPFRVVGAPGIDPFKVTDELSALGLPGLRFLPLEFRPMFQKEAMKRCGGVYIDITDRRAVRPLRAYIALLSVFRGLLGDEGFFRVKPYEFVTDIPAIELLLGDTCLIDLFYKRAPLDEIDGYLAASEQNWLIARRPFLLY
ncbi:MAG TPA: DUF1343 domain-containing protein [bacterium]|nr:DUF1343 domain-containing protein [bacterium]